ncbi:MAG: response regulator [Planctomycetota bacterium]
MTAEKDVLTTGEVAKICNVAPRTVSKWFDNGQLKGYRIPGSKDRRIPLGELVKFMNAHGIPTDGLDTGRPRVLIADSDTEVATTLKQVLSEQTNYEVYTASSAFEAGLACQRCKPHVVLIDIHLSDTDGQRFARFVRGEPNLEITRVVAMSGMLTEAQAMGLRREGFDGFLRKPFQVRQVVDAIEQATNIAA